MKRTFYFLLLTFYFSVGAFAQAQAGVLPETAKLIGPETMLLVEVENFGQLKEQFEKTNFYKLYKDPAMAAFVGELKTKLGEKIREADNEIAKAIFDADVLPQGRVAIALVLNEESKNAKEPLVLLITEWGETIGKIKEAVDKTVKKAIENGSHKGSEDYRGVIITTITKEDSSKLSYCFIDDCLIGSEGPELLKFVVAHIKGATSPTLAGDADYTATKGAIRPYHDIDFYANIKQIIKTMVVEDTTGQAKAMVANLGLDNVTFFGWSIGVSRLPGSAFSSKAFLKIDGGKKGICKMLELESAALRAPRFIPASTCSATFLNLNLKKAYDELANILKNLSPQAATVMYMPLLPASPDGEPGVELKRDIIDHLGSEIAIAQSINKPFSVSSAGTESLICLAVNNRKALEKSLSLLHGKLLAANKPDARRELLGHTIYLVSLPGLPFFGPGRTPMQAPLEESRERRLTHCQGGLLTGQGPAGASVPQMPAVAFTVTDTHLILGVESGVERAIRALSSTEATSVNSAKWFVTAKSAIPSVVGLAGLQDNAASWELTWRMMKESAKSKSKSEESSISLGIGASSKSSLPHIVFSQGGSDLFNFGLLPEFDAVRKYFGLSAVYGISRPDGFFFEFKYLNPSGG